MTIMILGSTGYLGYNILTKLVGEGNKVICVVRKAEDWIKLKVLENIVVISNDLRQIALTFEQMHVDCVINTVCAYKSNSIYGGFLESNVIYPLSVLEVAINYGIKYFINMGTSLPYDFNMYSFTKNKLSEFGRFLSEKKLISFVDLRLEMFYGGLNEPEERFMNWLRALLKKGQEIGLTSGVQKRDIIRVEDVVEIVIVLINELKESQNIGFYELHAGTGENHSLKSIVEYMKLVSDSTSELIFGAVPDREGGEPDTISNVDWLLSRGFVWRYSFWEGLKDYMSK